MKFIVDAQLPRRLAREMTALGADAIHTLDLPARNLTTDSEIRQIAAAEQRVVVTKDSDFVDSFLMHGEPAKMLFITTGNIPNDQLVHLLKTNWQSILQMLGQGDYVELGRTSLVLHM
jgi:predicted nuclease of predicted toxin-antitoxin system